jgi:hypothetical protein
MLFRRKNAPTYLRAGEEVLRETGWRRVSVEEGEGNKAMPIRIKTLGC